MDAYSQPPSHQSTLSTCRVTLDPVDGLSGQAGLSRNLSDTHRLVPQHGAHLDELLACEARLPTEVGALSTLLGVLDAGPLCCLGCLGLCLRGRGHKRDERITHSLLHRVSCRPVEGEVVDHRADHHAAPHELTDG